jgi:hypothetical protein
LSWSQLLTEPVALAVMLALCACKPKPPPVPAGLEAARVEAREAFSVGTPDRVRTACDRLTVHVMDLSKTHGAGAALRGLGTELMELSAAGLPALAARDAFMAWDVRLGRVLSGEPPGPGPRLRFDAPVAVRDAVAEVDDAFHRWSLGEACDGVDQTTMRLSAWRWEDPAPTRAASIQAALDVLDAMPATCRAEGVQSAQQTWDRAVALLAPGVE